MELKDKLKELRTQAGLTQEELANRLYVSRTLVSKWESGNRYPGADSLARLAILFSTTREELIGGQKEKDTYNRYNVVSLIYSVVCGILALGLIALLIWAAIEESLLHSGWTGLGGFVISIVWVLPVVVILTLYELITLKKKNGYKTLELYSLFSLILVWLISIVIYLYMI